MSKEKAKESSAIMEHEESELENNAREDNEYLVPEVAVRGAKRFWCSITVEPILFAVFLADGLSDSVISNFVLVRTCEVHFNYNKSVCVEMGYSDVNQSDIGTIVQPYSAVILTGMSFTSILFPAISSLFLGPWSDYNGRKLLLIVPAVGYFLKYMLLAVISLFPNLGPEYCLAAVIPVALTGGIVNFVSAVYSYASDISQEEDRCFKISILESVITAGVYVGLLSTSYIYKAGGTHGYILIYGLCGAVVIISTILTYLFVPESVQSTESGKGLLQIFELKLFKEMLEVCFKKREGYQRAAIFLVIGSLTIAISTSVGESNVFYLFTKLRFGWDVEEFSFWASALIATKFFGVIFGSVVLKKWLKLSDTALGVISYAMMAVSNFYIAFIPSSSPYLLYYSGLISIFGGLCGPVGRAFLSKSVPKEDLGKLFALTSSSESIAPLATGPLYTVLYTSTISTLPSAFLCVSGSLLLLCVVFYIIIYYVQKPNTQTEYTRMENECISS